MPMRRSSRWTTRRPPNGTRRTPPGSSETFILRDLAAGYVLYDDRFPFLFNSYYEAEGQRQAARAAA